jgi:hypothetical protein
MPAGASRLAHSVASADFGNVTKARLNDPMSNQCPVWNQCLYDRHLSVFAARETGDLRPWGTIPLQAVKAALTRRCAR